MSTVATRENIANIYVATFGRAPLDAGLDYWEGTGLSLEEIAENFFTQQETQDKYPPGTSNEDFVSITFTNMFNHTPAGDYWVKQLDAGNVTRDQMILQVSQGAQDGTHADETIIDNKTDVGLYYAESGLTDAHYSLADVNEMPAVKDSHIDGIYNEVIVFDLAPANTETDEGVANTFTLTATTHDFSAVGDTRTGMLEDTDVEFQLTPADPIGQNVGTFDTNKLDFNILDLSPVNKPILEGANSVTFDVTGEIDAYTGELNEKYAVVAKLDDSIFNVPLVGLSAEAVLLDVPPQVL